MSLGKGCAVRRSCGWSGHSLRPGAAGSQLPAADRRQLGAAVRAKSNRTRALLPGGVRAPKRGCLNDRTSACLRLETGAGTPTKFGFPA
ncbi:hypothetical protein [Kamptonema formosum]|uniref:hypothetical protein n=1 Tax=Kamptonema formosum TaxID=331992 RepID=UPI0012DF9C8E|nr:hypothetical protein [Oscillatoria sp. PCC 10802]